MKTPIALAALASILCLATGASAESASGYSSGGTTYVPYTAQGVALLDSFYFHYRDTDHHLAELTVRPQSNGYVQLALADHNRDDDFYYQVEHKRRTDAGIVTGTFTNACVASCLQALTPPGAGYVFALRGFRFAFVGFDHQIDKVGIVREGNAVRTFFNDRNDDDRFDVTVDYAWLPPAMVERTGILAGTDDGGRAETSLLGSDRAVISGFVMDYEYGGDHEIQAVGVATGASNNVVINFQDGNADDDFSYRVDYTVLRPPPPVIGNWSLSTSAVSR